MADAITAVFGLFRRCNKIHRRDDSMGAAKMRQTMTVLQKYCANLTRSVTIGAGLLHGFAGDSEKIVNQLNTTLRDYDDLDKFGLYESGNSDECTGNLICTSGCKRGYAESGEIKAAQKAEFEAETEETCGEAETAEEAEESAIDIEPKAEIEYDDFMKMQFQVGEIIACEAVSKSNYSAHR